MNETCALLISLICYWERSNLANLQAEFPKEVMPDVLCGKHQDISLSHRGLLLQPLAVEREQDHSRGKACRHEALQLLQTSIRY